MMIAMPITSTASETVLSQYKVGDIITFGSYPQSKVTDSETIESLNNIDKTWISYDYFISSGEWYLSNKIKTSDFMKYADISYNGIQYRAVTFSAYRTYFWGYFQDMYQQDNGYYKDNIYYFKYEPLQWRILDPDEGYVMCTKAIDAQAYQYFVFQGDHYELPLDNCYNNESCTDYASDWGTSSIREWLNNYFYKTAFNENEKNQIGFSFLESLSRYDQSTYDKIFLISESDAKNSKYGFNTSSDKSLAREIQPTDYALCQGCYCNSYGGTEKNNNTYWWTRTPRSSFDVFGIDPIGRTMDPYEVKTAYMGVVPAFKFISILATPEIYKTSFDNQGANTTGTTVLWYKYNTVENGVYYYYDQLCTRPFDGYQIVCPKKNGYIFGGYFTGKNGTGTQYVKFDGTCIYNMYKIAESRTLYAYWIDSKDNFGDINADGSVNSSDALLALQHSVGQINLTDDKFIRGDVTKDNQINSSDALKILQYSVGQIDKF